jgi:flagellar biogenesis protein FliO
MATRSAVRPIEDDRPAPKPRSRRSAESAEMRSEILHFFRAIALLVGFVLALGWLMS